MTTRLFSELGLSAEVLKAIDKLGFEQASPIQAEAIPVLLAGGDVVGQSQTGSGKTAAFAIPAIEKIDPQLRAVQTLILCPTRELAVQVAEETHKLALFKRGIQALPIYGGQSYERQFEGLRHGAQIVIGTPGRVMDHMRRGTLRLDKIKMVILDEADEMLDMGFHDDIEFILKGVPAERQTVFFSATMPRPIQELIRKYSRDAQHVRIEQRELTVPTVEQTYYEIDRRSKAELLTRLIDLYDLNLGIIFCNTKKMVDDLVDHLNALGYSADRLHGDMSQPMRDRVMNKFRKSGLEFLVATDVAARGIDVEDVQVVFNYDPPYGAEDYLHRIGRTGRAGRSGRAITFVSGREVYQIQQIERYTKVRMQRGRIPSPAEVEEARQNVFLDKLRATLKEGEFKSQNRLVEMLLEEGFSSTDIASALLHLLRGQEEPPHKAEDLNYRPREERGDRFGNRPERFERRERPERPERPARRKSEEVSADAPRKDAAAAKPKGKGTRHGIRVTEEAAAAPAPDTVSAPAPAAAAEPVVAAAAPAEPAAPVAPVAPVAPATPVAPVAPVAEVPKVAAPAAEPKASAQALLEKVKHANPAPSAPRAEAKHSRHTPEGQTRLFMSVGSEMQVSQADIVQAITTQTGLPASVVGTVDIRERHLFVDVQSEHAETIVTKLNRRRMGDRRLKVKPA